FVLEIDYTLSAIEGTLATLAAGARASSAFMVLASRANFSESRVELFRRGRRVAQTGVGPTGRWRIGGLLPGKYAVRAFNGLEYTRFQDVELLEGETRDVGFVFDPLPAEQVFAFPNPARRTVTFRFVSALPGLDAQIRVFDIAGILVREITGSEMTSPSPALYHADWDLTNMNGEAVASGVYLFIVKVKGSNGQSGKVIKKLAVVR
ncbi:MAG: T9SS type A sorting domain-containing protein, partial [Elusimicrobiota bacterium]